MQVVSFVHLGNAREHQQSMRKKQIFGFFFFLKKISIEE